MEFEQQIQRLEELGITLNDGVAADDLLEAWPRERYENEPFDLLLTWLGAEMDREPWVFSPHVLTVDCECIEDAGSYVSLIGDICKLAGAESYVTDIQDFVDIDNEVAWIRCKIDGVKHHWDVDVCNDWADTLSLAKIMTEIERNGSRFYWFDDGGQGFILFYLDEQTAASIDNLTRYKIKPVSDEVAG